MSFVFDVAAGRQANALGKYNQSVQNRNALVKEQEAEAIEKQKEFDIAKFDQQFSQLQGQTKTAVLKSGAELSGSGLRVLRYNAEQGVIARREGKIAQLGYYAKAGQSLMAMSGGFGGGGSTTGQFGSTANNSSFSNYS